MAWKYSLVIQFPLEHDDDLDRFDSITQFEDELTESLAADADVDGHDAGAGEMNIFVFSNTPQKTFERTQMLLHSHPGLSDYRAAYRDVDGEGYTILWPPGLTAFTVA